MKSLSLFLLGISTILLLMVGPAKGLHAMEADSYESDNQPASAKNLALGTDQERTIHQEGDVDWMVMNAVKGFVYEVSTTILEGSNPDMVLEIFTPEGNLAVYDDDNSEGLAPAVSWKAAYTGYYYVKTKTFGRGFMGQYNESGGGFGDCRYTVKAVRVPNHRYLPIEPLAGPDLGETGVACLFSTKAVDEDNHPVYYDFDWGDGSKSLSLTDGAASHVFLLPRAYVVKVRATDSRGTKSQWSKHTIHVQSRPIQDSYFDVAFCSDDLGSFILAEMDSEDLSAPRSVTSVANSQGNSEKPFPVRLKGSRKGLLYTATTGFDPTRSVLFKNLDSGRENKMFQSMTSPQGEYYVGMYARGIQLGNGKILAAFSETDVNYNRSKTSPATSVIRVFLSGDYGESWRQAGLIQSDPNEFPAWSGMWQPSPLELKDGSIALAATETNFRADGVCTDTGLINRYRDDTVAFFKSSDGGKSWPFKRRIHVGPCGYDFNEPALAELSDGSLVVVYHNAKTGDLVWSQSVDGGNSWAAPRTVVNRDDLYVNRVPRLMVSGDNILVVYLKRSSDADSRNDKWAGVWLMPDGTVSAPVDLPVPESARVCKDH